MYPILINIVELTFPLLPFSFFIAFYITIDFDVVIVFVPVLAGDMILVSL